MENESKRISESASVAPLADRIRPQTLETFVGQEHLVGKKGILRKLIESDYLPSMIFWGPPGCGKTTLAQVIANTTNSHFVHFSAVTANLNDVRRVVRETRERLEIGEQLLIRANQQAMLDSPRGKKMTCASPNQRKSRPSGSVRRTVLFLDEIHRFNKAQQDALLPHVEKGTIILIGATTENPSFEVIGPLLSRCRVFVLHQLTFEELSEIVRRGVRYLKMAIDPQVNKFLIESSNGDARIALNALEIATSINQSGKKISLQLIKEVFQKKTLLYDRAGEEHYNTISAFIKSMRASDVNAALYYLARMIEAGEDPLFIARRMVIFASEDIGMGQPTALVVANEVFRACETIGYPECAINLAHGVVYLAKAPKDRSAYNGLRAAQEDVQQHGNLPIPMNLRNPVTKLMKEVGYGKGYEKYPGKDKSLLPEKLGGKKYYKPD